MRNTHPNIVEKYKKYLFTNFVKYGINKNMNKKHHTIGCCGVDCGLCPRYYTDGSSKCPGCFGIDFENKHPPCSFANCCFKKHNFEICSLCDEFPCTKYDKQKIEKDSFVSHKKIYANHNYIKTNGLESFINVQKTRITLLETLLKKYNDNRSKNFYCIAASLLSMDSINKITEFISKNGKTIDIKIIKEKICEYSKEENIKLKLDK
jgi:hypothetical protein